MIKIDDCEIGLSIGGALNLQNPKAHFYLVRVDKGLTRSVVSTVLKKLGLVPASYAETSTVVGGVSNEEIKSAVGIVHPSCLKTRIKEFSFLCLGTTISGKVGTHTYYHPVVTKKLSGRGLTSHTKPSHETIKPGIFLVKEGHLSNPLR